MRAARVTVFAAVLTLVAAAGCSRAPDADRAFVGLATRYLDRMLDQNPEWATNLGDHRFDHQVSDLSAEGFAARLELARTTLDSLAHLDKARLSQVNRIDAEILAAACEGEVFAITELREHTWNPTWYNPGDGIYNLLARDFAPAQERLAAAISRIRQIPRTIAAAQQNLQAPPAVMTRTAIDRLPGVINLVTEVMDRELAQAPQLQAAYPPIRAEAVAALEEFGRWLEDDLLPRSTGDFRIGCEKFRRQAAVLPVVGPDARRDPGRRRDGPAGDPRRAVPGGRAPVRQVRPGRRGEGPRQGRGDPRRARSPGRGPPRQRDHHARGAARPRADHGLRARARPGHRARRRGRDHRHARAPARLLGGLLRLAGPAGGERHHLLRHQPHARVLVARARRDLLPRVQRLDAAGPDHPRGHARPLPADRPRQRLHGAHAPARHLLQRHLRRGLGHLRRAADGRGRLRGPRAADAAAEDAPAPA